MRNIVVSLAKRNLKRKNLCKNLASGTLALLLAAFIYLPVMAASPSAYSVRAVIPENQIDSRLTYFDLLVSPEDRQVLQVAITNSEQREVVAHVALCPASTAQNGLIVYTDPEVRDESIELAITDFATVLTPTIRIPAGGTAMAEIRLDVPVQPFEGVVLGGISFTADYAEEPTEDAQQDGLQIENRYAYVIGVKLRESLEDTGAAPDFHLKDIQPGLVNYRQALLVTLQQSEPFIANGLDVFARVTKADDPDFVRNLALDNAQMAPNSNGDFVIDWAAPVAPGTYRLYMRVEREDRIWEWDEEFTIGADIAAQVNEESLQEHTMRAGPPLWMLVLLAVLTLMVLLLLILLFRRKKKSSDSHR